MPNINTATPPSPHPRSYPLLSLASDWLMAFNILTGREGLVVNDEAAVGDGEQDGAAAVGGGGKRDE